MSTTATTASAPSAAASSQRSVRHQRQEFLKLAPALRAFRAQHGHIAVPLRFSIPAPPSSSSTSSSTSCHTIAGGATTTADNSSNEWPTELHGMKLGTTLSRFLKVAQRPENAAIAAQLEALGVPIDTIDGDWKRFLWETVAVAALQTYRTLYGDFFVPYTFTVPCNDAQWPVATWGYKLGYWVVELRRDPQRLTTYQQRDLRAIQFVWSARAARWNAFFVPAMQTFAALYGTDTRVPQTFVVPQDDARWPLALRGYRLGQKVNNLRCGGGSSSNSGSASKASRDDDSEDWDDAELVYNNWMLLDLLHASGEVDTKVDTEVDTNVDTASKTTSGVRAEKDADVQQW